MEIFEGVGVLVVSIIAILSLVSLARLLFLFVGSDIYEIAYAIRRRKDKKTHKKYRPFLSVVIPAYNEEAVIAQTVQSVMKSSYSNFEVIVVNDGSKDNTDKIMRALVKKYKAKKKAKLVYLKQSNSGKANALNNAMKNIAKGDLVMCLDGDSILHKQAISNAVKYFVDPKVKAVAANVKIINSNTLLGLAQKLEYAMGYHLKKSLTIANVEYIIGGVGSTFRKEILETCNYYDTDTITEDIDLTMKIVGQGNKENRVVFAGDVIGYTEGPLTLKALFKQRYRWKFGRMQTFYKNKDLFFNKDKKHSKLLTFFYLPYMLFGDIDLLIEPIFFFFMMGLSIYYRDTATFIFIMLYTAFFAGVAVFSDKDISNKERLQLTLAAPFAYPFFFVITIVEYLTVIKCIINLKGVFNTRANKDMKWEHVERLGAAAKMGIGAN